MPYTVNNKVYTDHALMDEIIHNCKIIMDDIIIKDSEKADENETERSLADSEIFISIKDNEIDFSFFPFTKEYLMDYGYEPYYADVYLANRYEIPSEDREDLMQYCCDRFLNEYEEENNYYRMLNGMPEYGTNDYDIYIKYSDYSDLFDKVYIEFDFTKPLHKYSKNQLTTLETLGIIDDIKAKYSNNGRIIDKYRYLNYLAGRSIDIITARKAGKWDILYMPAADYMVSNRFRELYNINRDIYLQKVDQMAYRVESKYYEQMVMFMIVCQTFNDVVVDTPEWYIRRDIIDIRSAQYFLESQGVEFFADIPLRYQIRIVKNINKLIRYKSTNQNIHDILAIFGSPDTIVYKYYLMKNWVGVDTDPEIPPGYYPSEDDPIQKEWETLIELDCGNEDLEPLVINTGDGHGNDVTIDPYGREIRIYDFQDDGTLPVYIFDFGDEDGDTANDTSTTEARDEYYQSSIRKVRDKYGNIYDLEFFKTPIDDDYDNYIRNELYRESYDEIVSQDKYWNGEDGYYYIKNQHKEQDFTIAGTKFMGLEYNVFMENYLYQKEYYLGLLFNNAVDINDISIAVPQIRPNASFNLRNLLIFLYCCNALYYDIDLVVENPLDHFANRVEDKPEFLPYRYYDGGDASTESNQQWDGHSVSDQFEEYHEYIDGGLVEYTNNLNKETYADYIREKHPEVFLDIARRIYGFNMDVDLEQLQEEIGFRHSKFGFERGYTLAELGVDDYWVVDHIETVDELYEVYTHNTECFMRLRSWFQNSSNRDERRIYDYVYYKLFTTKFNLDLYTMADGSIATEYGQILEKYDYTLYMKFLELKNETNPETRIAAVREITNAIIDTLNYYIAGDNLKYVLTFAESNSLDSLLHYINEMINFFKSWKTYFLDPKVNYTIGDSGMVDADGNKLGGSSSPEYLVTYGDQLGELVEKFWVVENGFTTDSLVVDDTYIFEDNKIENNPNLNAEVVDIASHYEDEDIFGDKMYDGGGPTYTGEPEIIIDGGGVKESSYSPYFIVDGGESLSRYDPYTIDGGGVLEAPEYIMVDGGEISDHESQYAPIMSLPAKEQYHLIDGGWASPRYILSKTMVTRVNSGTADDGKFTNNMISMETRIADYENNGLIQKSDGLYFDASVFGILRDYIKSFEDGRDYKDHTVDTLKELYDTLIAYATLEGAMKIINETFGSTFANVLYVLSKMGDGTYDETLRKFLQSIIDKTLVAWWDQNNPYVWREFVRDVPDSAEPIPIEYNYDYF